MGFDFNSEIPIYLQIIEYVKNQIISGKYKPNEKIPSVRELAMQLEVNPNTVQKALIELEEMKLIITESTNGKFVTGNIHIINKLKKEKIKEQLQKLDQVFCDLGLNNDEIKQIIKDKYGV